MKKEKVKTSIFDKKVIVIYDDKDKVSSRLGTILEIKDGFLVIQTQPKGKQVIELIPLNRVIRIELLEGGE